MSGRALLRRYASSLPFSKNLATGNLRTLTNSAKKLKEERAETAVSLPQLKNPDERFLTEDQFEYKRSLPDKIVISDKEDVGAVSGVPEEHIKSRRVRIYMPAKSAMQSGTNNVKFWQLEFEARERWENPLMGWASTGDPMSNLKVDFASKEEAIRHCQRMGWPYFVDKEPVVRPKARSYGMNFAWNKRTRVSTK